MPFYINILGEKEYGIIMFYVTIQSIITLLDSGFSATLRREFSWGEKDGKFVGRASAFLRTIEIFYAIIFFVVFILTWLCSEFLVNNLFNAPNLDDTYNLNYILLLMVVNALTQMQSNLYNGGILALEHQLKSNILQITYTLFKNGIVILIIYLFPNPIAFLLWQLLVTLIYIAIQRYIIYNDLHGIARAETYPNSFKSIFLESWQISSLFLGMSIVSTLNFQSDKVIIAKVLEVEYIGYYGTAYALGQIIVSLIGPIGTAISPRLINLYSIKDFKQIRALFHKFATIATILSTSVGGILFLNSKIILTLWTRNPSYVERVDPIVPYMVVAGIFLSAQVIPYIMGVATVALRPIILIGIVNIAICIPSYYIFAHSKGVLGVALVWCISNGVIVFFNCFYYINKFANWKEYIKWMFNDFFVPAIICLSTVYIVKVLMPTYSTWYGQVISLLLQGFSCLIVVGGIYFHNNLKDRIKLILSK